MKPFAKTIDSKAKKNKIFLVNDASVLCFYHGLMICFKACPPGERYMSDP